MSQQRILVKYPLVLGLLKIDFKLEKLGLPLQETIYVQFLFFHTFTPHQKMI